MLTYGHGDTVRGLDDQWDAGLKPWVLTEDGDRWYGRGTADNKGQHALNLTALEHVLAERGGRLGFNLKIVLETSEERGSTGLRDFVAAHAAELAADVLIASDGPRVASDVPTMSTGTRGSFHFDLVLNLRPGGVHSGNWGGMTTDPAIVLAHAHRRRSATATARSWCAAGCRQDGMPTAVRAALAGCEMVAEGEAATIDPGWGEPGFTAAEKIYGWTSFIVLAMVSGRPENPVNAVAPDARAHCQIRYTVDSDPHSFEPALRRAPGCGRFPRGGARERRRAHAGQPHRPCRPLGRFRQGQHGAFAGPSVCRSSPTPAAACPATCSSITSGCRWSGFPTATTAASSTARTSISSSPRRARACRPSPASGGTSATNNAGLPQRRAGNVVSTTPPSTSALPMANGSPSASPNSAADAATPTSG